MAQQTPNLKKLEEKFEALFKEETEDSFNKWLADKQQQNNNNMAQQTPQINPIDWLKDRLYKSSSTMQLLSAAYVIDQFEQANEMFKQQIENAQMDMFNHINDKKFGMDYFHKRDAALIYAEDYYNETYGNNIKQ
jgi:hypothetical protein